MSFRTLRPAALAAGAAAFLAAAGAQAAPIPGAGPSSLPAHTGAAVKAHKAAATKTPQNPYMARNPWSNIHNDSWMTDAYAVKAPLGAGLKALSYSYNPSLCGSIAFDTHKNIVSVCPSSISALPMVTERR